MAMANPLTPPATSCRSSALVLRPSGSPTCIKSTLPDLNWPQGDLLPPTSRDCSCCAQEEHRRFQSTKTPSERYRMPLLIEEEIPSVQALASLLRSVVALPAGQRIHAEITRLGLEQEPFLANLLIALYRKFGVLDNARAVFDNLQYPRVVAWNSMIAAYCQYGRNRDALQLFQRMLERGHKPNRVTFLCILGACVSPESLAHGKWIHAYVVKGGFKSDMGVGNALITMYSRCGALKTARSVFDEMKLRNLVTWNAMIAAYSKDEHGKQALELFQKMERQGVKPDKFTFVSMLSVYASPEMLADGKDYHERIRDHGLETDIVVGNALVNMYGRCGALDEAVSVFGQMHQRDVVSWTTMIDAYCHHGHANSALRLFQQMQHLGAKPNKVTFVSVLRACAALAALEEGKAIHAMIRDHRLEADVLVGNALMYMYGKCGAVKDAHAAFDKMHEHDAVSWTVMIHAYSVHGYGKETFQLFEEMQQKGMEPDKSIFVSVLRACAMLAALPAGKAIHACIRDRGFQSDVSIGNALVNMYSKCGDLKKAHSIFDKMHQHDVVSWNAMITAYGKDRNSKEAFHCFSQMQDQGVQPDEITFLCILGACTGLTGLAKGKDVHTRIVESGLEGEIFLGNALINMYGKCGAPEDARVVFDKMQLHDVVSWNTMIVAYIHHRNCEAALGVFRRMQEQGVEPDKVTFISILDACAKLKAPAIGKALHACILDHGWEADINIASSLINMYGKCKLLKEAQEVFDGMCEGNVVAWTALIDAYSQCGCFEEVVHLFRSMQESGMLPNKITYVNILGSCANPAVLEEGKMIHARIIDRGCEPDVIVGNALVSMYGKCESVKDALDVFDNMDQRDVVSWTAMIDAYSKCGHDQEALELYEQMQQEGVGADKVTYITILHACANLKALTEGKLIHASIIDAGLGSDSVMKQALLDMYSKCCALEKVFL